MLKVEGIKKSYKITKDEEIAVLHGIDLTFPDKGMYVILGPSGSGKTTLLSILGALEEADEGKITFNDKEITHLSEKEKNKLHQDYFSFIFQDHNLIDYLNLFDNSILKTKKSEKVEEVLTRLGISQFKSKKPHELSGGERERCAIARAILADTKVVFCDEPTASLDSKNAENVISFLKEISEEKLVIIVSHDEKLCAKYTNNLIYIKDGRIENNDFKKIENSSSFEKVDFTKSNALYHGNLFSRSFKHSLFKYKHTLLISILTFIAYLCVCVIIGLAYGSREVINRSIKSIMHSNPLTVGSYYEDFSQIKILTDRETTIDGLVHAQKEGTLTDSLHINPITKDFIDYITENPLESTYFSFNNDVMYNVIYERNGIYNLYDNRQNTNLNDYLEMFFGRRTVFSELIYDKDYYEKNFECLAGHFPTSDNEVMVLLDNEYLVNADVLKILNVKDGDDPKTFIDKEFYLAPHDDIFVVNESKEVTGHYIKDIDTLVKEGKDIRTITNYILQFANAFFDGNKTLQNEATNNIIGLFKEEAETKILNAYSKIENPAELKKIAQKYEDTNKLKVVGVFKTPANSAFNTRGEGILIRRSKLEETREQNSHSRVSQEFDNHIVLSDPKAEFVIPTIYGYNNTVRNYGSASIEENVMSYLDFFENRKYFSVNNDFSSIEIYPASVEDKAYYEKKIDEYNKQFDDARQIKQLDLTKKIIKYFSKYYGVIEKVLYSISVVTLIVSAILIVAIIFNLVALRVKEIGILRASGFSTNYVFILIEIEMMIIGLVSGSLAVICGQFIMPALNNFFESTMTGISVSGIAHLTPLWSILIVGMALIMSFISALVPSIIYSKKKPAEILKS